MAEGAADKLKRELEDALDAVEAEHASFADELAITAATSGEVAGDEEPALVVLKDKTLPAETRVAVIQRLAAGISRRHDFIEALLAIVQDADDDAEVRAAALQLLGAAAFQVARFGPHEDAYKQALRNLVTDDDATLRETAVDTLALDHDPEIQQVLLAGLQGDGPIPVPRERAIQLLAEDDHLDNLPLLQELYESDSDDLRQDAIRLMSAYPAARETLESVLQDRDEATQVRQQSAASLYNVAPERFEELAKQIATDATDYDEVRTISLRTLQHLADDSVYDDGDFLRALEEVGADDAESPVAKYARSFIEQRPDNR